MMMRPIGTPMDLASGSDLFNSRHHQSADRPAPTATVLAGSGSLYHHAGHNSAQDAQDLTPSDHLRRSLSLLPWWVRLSTAVNYKFPKVLRLAFVVSSLAFVCHLFYELGIFSLMTSVALFVTNLGPFLGFNYVFRGACCTGLLGDLVDACDQAGDREEVSKVMAAADAEAKFHVANAGGPLAACGAVYFVLVKPLVENRSEDYGNWLMIETAIVTVGWVSVHTFYAWGTAALLRVCSKLLSVVIKNHVASITSTLRDSSLDPKEKLSKLSSDQVSVERLFASANAALSAPCMGMVIGISLGSLSLGLEVLMSARSGESATPLVASGLMGALLAGAAFLLLFAMASVHDAYSSALAPVKHSLDLINLAQEVFPGNGLSYLACLQSEMALGFNMLDEPINSRLVVSIISSFAKAVLVAIVLGQAM